MCLQVKYCRHSNPVPTNVFEDMDRHKVTDWFCRYKWRMCNKIKNVLFLSRGIMWLTTLMGKFLCCMWRSVATYEIRCSRNVSFLPVFSSLSLYRVGQNCCFRPVYRRISCRLKLNEKNSCYFVCLIKCCFWLHHSFCSFQTSQRAFHACNNFRSSRNDLYFQPVHIN